MRGKQVKALRKFAASVNRPYASVKAAYKLLNHPQRLHFLARIHETDARSPLQRPSP